MANLGHRNVLPIVRETAHGLYLHGGSRGEILLPRRYVPPVATPGTRLDVFIHRDSEDRLVATTQSPLAEADEFACLRVVSMKRGIGTFLDWGLEKDLLLPMREQTKPLREGAHVVVRVALDEQSDRIFASMRLHRWLNLTPPTYAEGERVKLLIASETPLGFNAIVNGAHRGLLYRAELAGPLAIGDRVDGSVREVRADGKIDLGLDPAGYRRIAPLTGRIVEALTAAGGFLPYHDQSAPEEIRAAFGASKKAFKQAIGALYREHRIRIEPDGIRLAAKPGHRTSRA